MTRSTNRTPGRLAAAGAAALVTLAATAATPGTTEAQAQDREPRFGIVIHGGAGTILRENMTPEREAAYRAKLAEALEAGHRILAGGGSSLDAVEAAIRVMEDSPLFNAGKGAVFTHEGTNELDASIMDGRNLAAGAVAGVKHLKNPITLARRVMEASPHVFMSGAGAEAFAREQGLELVPADYFFTEARWQALQRARERDGKAALPRPAAADTATQAGAAPAGPGRSGHAARAGNPGPGPTARANAAPAGAAAGRTTAGEPHVPPDDRKFGTVGAVALDRAGNLAAGTSTGGMTNKRFGRIGDAPVIGAGTYADNGSCAVSATGHGEYFIRNVVAYDICALVKYRGLPLREAAESVIMEKLVAQGADGGIIAVDPQGNYTMTFNSAGMYRGYMGPDGKPVIGIYRD